VRVGIEAGPQGGMLKGTGKMRKIRGGAFEESRAYGTLHLPGERAEGAWKEGPVYKKNLRGGAQ